MALGVFTIAFCVLAGALCGVWAVGQANVLFKFLKATIGL
jgi:hypothetical protein